MNIEKCIAKFFKPGWAPEPSENIEFTYFKLWKLSATRFASGTFHPDKPEVERGFKIVRANMRVNGPHCKTKRWWIYTAGPAYCIDWT